MSYSIKKICASRRHAEKIKKFHKLLKKWKIELDIILIIFLYICFIYLAIFIDLFLYFSFVLHSQYFYSFYFFYSIFLFLLSLSFYYDSSTLFKSIFIYQYLFCSHLSLVYTSLSFIQLFYIFLLSFKFLSPFYFLKRPLLITLSKTICVFFPLYLFKFPKV